VWVFVDSTVKIFYMTPVILGCDFLLKHHVTLKFCNGTFHCVSPSPQSGRLNTQVEHFSILVLDDDLSQAMHAQLKIAVRLKQTAWSYGHIINHCKKSDSLFDTIAGYIQLICKQT